VTVFTYSENLPGNEDEQKALIELWKESWSKRGWRPEVLGREHAQDNPRFSVFRDRIASFPTVNTRDYEDVCWLRWLAFEQVGGGIIVDADVINYSLRPEDFVVEVCASHDASGSSGFVSASAEGARSLVTRILTLPEGDCVVSRAGRPHISDMFVVAKYVPPSGCQCCRVYSWPRWFECPCVHYANATLWRDFPQDWPHKAPSIRCLREL
jgi:hypothetical protein